MLLLLLGVAAYAFRPAVRTIWGVGMLVVFVHCLIDYPMQQRPALAAFFFAMLGAAFVGLRLSIIGSVTHRFPFTWQVSFLDMWLALRLATFLYDAGSGRLKTSSV